MLFMKTLYRLFSRGSLYVSDSINRKSFIRFYWFDRNRRYARIRCRFSYETKCPILNRKKYPAGRCFRHGFINTSLNGRLLKSYDCLGNFIGRPRVRESIRFSKSTRWISIKNECYLYKSFFFTSRDQKLRTSKSKFVGFRKSIFYIFEFQLKDYLKV